MVKRFAKAVINGQARLVKLPLPTGGLANRWMLASDTAVPPHWFHSVPTTQRHSTNGLTLTTPDYPVFSALAVWSNWWTRHDGILYDPASNKYPEVDNTNPITVRATWTVDDTTWTPFLWAGQPEVVIQPGANAVADPIIPSSAWVSRKLRIRTYRYAESGTSPGNYRVTELNKGIEGTRYFSDQASALALLNGGTIVDNSFSDSAFGYGPSLVAVKGAVDRPVVFLAGDSIAFGDNGISWATLGLSSTANGRKRLPFANFAVQGTRPAEQATLMQGQYRRKDSLIQELVTLNGGLLPFTAILSEMGVNSSGSAAQAAAFDNVMRNWWAFLKSRYPGVPLTQTTLTPKSTWSNLQPYTDYANQTALEDARWPLNASLPSHVAAGRINHFIDTIGEWTGNEPSNPHVWRPADFRTTLAADVAANALVIQTVDAPPIGASLAIDHGSANAEATYGAVTGVTGTGPYTVTVINPVKAHSAGATVAEIPTRDGIHPSTRTGIVRGVVEKVSAAKDAGYFS